MENQPLVSILIPTYNRAWHIRETIHSALTQNYANLEVIVVDDASTDDTAQVVRAISDARLTYARQAQNVGMVANWGACLERAAGKFVVFLSDDDLLRPDFVANRVGYLTEDTRVNVVFSRYDVQDRNGERLSTCNSEWGEARRLAGRALLDAALARRWFVGAGMYRRSAIVPLWPRLAQDNLVLDFGLNLRLAMQEGIGVYIPDNDFVMMEHPGQNSQAKHERVLQEGEDTLRRILAESPPADCAMLLRRELANWNVVWGRLLFARGQARAGRAHFRRALGWEPRLRWAWQQLALSWIAPQRLSAPSSELRVG